MGDTRDHAGLAIVAMLVLGQMALGAEPADPKAGEKLWVYCAFCHNADGLGQTRSEAPKLAGQAAWYTERQLRYFIDEVRGYHPEDIPGKQMTVYSGPLYDDEAIRSMAAYIETMPVSPENPRPDRMRRRPRRRPYEWNSQFAKVTTDKPGDPEAGKKLYAGCAICHGEDALGNEVMNAPRLDNKQDWYLVRQLKYFKYGARGTHDDDVHGRQMAAATTLENDQEIVDVVAHIMTMSKGPLY
ncbi:MAG: c-type cytochrome [bacterium]|nr:c-type cytochrome [bacterium]